MRFIHFCFTPKNFLHYLKGLIPTHLKKIYFKDTISWLLRVKLLWKTPNTYSHRFVVVCGPLSACAAATFNRAFSYQYILLISLGSQLCHSTHLVIINNYFVVFFNVFIRNSFFAYSASLKLSKSLLYGWFGWCRVRMFIKQSFCFSRFFCRRAMLYQHTKFLLLHFFNLTKVFWQQIL